MFKLARLLYGHKKSFLPSKEALALIKEGSKALEQNDFKGALEKYNQIPESDKQNKCVIGFFGGIENKEKMNKFTEKVIAAHNLRKNN